ARLEICQTIAAIAERARDRIEPREKVDDRRRVAAEGLLEAEMGRPVPKLAGRQGLERVIVGPIEIGARCDSLDCVHDQIEIDETARGVAIESPSRDPQGGRELLRRQRRVAELARRAAALDGPPGPAARPTA